MTNSILLTVEAASQLGQDVQFTGALNVLSNGWVSATLTNGSTILLPPTSVVAIVSTSEVKG